MEAIDKARERVEALEKEKIRMMEATSVPGLSLAANKNSILQSKILVNPRGINRGLQRCRSVECLDERDGEPPFHRVVCMQPCIPIENYDKSCTTTAYGWVKINRLLRELNNESSDLVNAALNTAIQLMHNPEYASHAVTDGILLDLVALLYCNIADISRKVVKLLIVLAQYRKVKLRITKSKLYMKKIELIMNSEDDKIRMGVAMLLERISEYWPSADRLVDQEFITLITGRLISEDEDKVVVLLRTLRNLSYCTGRCIAFYNNAFNVLVELLYRKDTDVLSNSLECLMVLTVTKVGKNMAYKSNLLRKLAELTFDERPQVHTAAMGVLMNCTVKVKSKIVISEIEGMTKRLIDLANVQNNKATQLYAIKTLTNISEYPKTRKLIQKFYSEEIAKIYCNDDEDLMKHKEILTSVVCWTPDSNS